MKPATVKTMEHKQYKNAFAYVIYEKATMWLKEEGPTAPWHRRLMFYAYDDLRDRDEMWKREVTWRDPEKIRVVPLYDEDSNDARREANLDAINAQYQADERTTLASAVETTLKTNLPLDRFEGLIRTLQSFEELIQAPLSGPTSSIRQMNWTPAAQEIEDFRREEKEKDSTLL